MPPNRDTVCAAYMRAIAVEVLNATYDLMNDDTYAETWMKTALESKRIDEPAVKHTVTKRYGDKVAIWSPNTDASMKAAEAGEVLHPRSMSKAEREHIREMGGVESTATLFGKQYVAADPAAMNEVRGAFAEWVVDLAAPCSLSANVQFITAPTRVAAQCSSDTATPTVTFNVYHLSDTWFAERGPDQIELVVHELALAVAQMAMQHGPAWGDSCCRVAGILASM